MLDRFVRRRLAPARLEAALAADPRLDPVLGDHGYPSELELERIARWPAHDLPGLFRYLEERWGADAVALLEVTDPSGERVLRFSVAGRDRRMRLLDALRENGTAWLICWQRSCRCGEHEFRVPSAERDLRVVR